jgi:predicted Fe-Mo cluster-binding NifX family protein
VRVAVSIWQERISPVCDVAEHFLVVDFEGTQTEEHGTVTVQPHKLLRRVEALREVGTEVVICGAISRVLETAFRSSGIRIVPYVCGPVDKVVRAYAEDRLNERRFIMPGCAAEHRESRRKRSENGSGNGSEPPR